MPFAMNSVLGSGGAFLMMTVLMMSLMSTGSGEVMSISSIIVYDIYKTYVSPFRFVTLHIDFFVLCACFVCLCFLKSLPLNHRFLFV